jgi:thioredoxin 1
LEIKITGAIMNKTGKIVTVAVLIAAVSIVVALKQNKPTEVKQQTSTALPRLVDLGAGKCIPCKLMAPILEELKTEYAKRFEVVFIDVWKDPSRSEEYGIKIIPTQIFFDASGKELFRHEGFFSKADILAKWKELGIDLEQKQE